MKTPDRTVSDSMEPLVYPMTLVGVGNEHGPVAASGVMPRVLLILAGQVLRCVFYPWRGRRDGVE
jgi:hypothetical protein